MKVEVYFLRDPMGLLIEDSQSEKIYFQYAPDFLKKGLNPSPLHLNYDLQPQACLIPEFKYLFGIFYDALPDQWGMSLLEEKLRRAGIERKSPLLLLSYLGERSMGALSFKPKNDSLFKSESLCLEKISQQSRRFLTKHRGVELSEALLRTGTSPGGARPKIFAGLNPKTHQVITGKGLLLPKGYEHWMIKLGDGSTDPNGFLEYFYGMIAQECGIQITEQTLIPSKNSEGLFASKRFDRFGKTRIHYHSYSGISHTPFSASTDYDDLLGIIRAITKDQRQVLEGFRRATFNLIGCVRDDHVKNHGFLLQNNQWKLAPAFDLLPSKWEGAHALGYRGEHRHPTLKSLEIMGLYHSISRSVIQETIESVQKAFKKVLGMFEKKSEVKKLAVKLKQHWKNL